MILCIGYMSGNMSEITQIIKIDYDHKSIAKYINKILPIAEILYYDGLKLKCIGAYDTAHGKHLYFTANKEFTTTEILLIESLLHSDLRKQAINYVEDTDILFKNKRGVEATRNTKDEDKVNKGLNRVYSKKVIYKKVVVK